MTTLFRHFVASAAMLALLSVTGCNLQSSESEAIEHIKRSETYAAQGQYRAAFLEVRNAIQKEPGQVDHVLTLAHLYNEVGAGGSAAELLQPWEQDHADAISLELARAYVLQNKHLSAQETLDGYTPQTDSQRLQYQWLQGEIARLAGRPTQAIEHYQSVLNDQPEHAAATAGHARVNIRQGNTLTALEQLQAWRGRNGDDPDLLFLQGLIHYRLNELEPAVNVLTDGLAAMPQSDIFLPVRRQTLSLLSRTLTEQGKLADAQVYNRILAENTDSEARQSTEAALEAIGEGDLDTARLTLEDLVEQNPNNDLVALLLGAVKLQQGDLDEGESLLAANIDAETTPIPFIRLATMAQIDKGKRDQALATLERALLARPTDVDLLAMHGILALSLPTRASEGMVSLNKALQIDNSRTRLRLALAQFHVQNDDVEQALGQLRAAFSQSPSDWPTTNYYVHLLMEHGHIDEAESVKNTLLDTRSDDPNATVLASLTEFRLGDTDSAIRRLKNQTQARPDWIVPHRALATLYQQQGQREAAIEAHLSAAELEEDSVRSLQQAGRLYAANHNPDQVVDWLLQTGESRPNLAEPGAALAAQIRIQQRQFDEARRILDAHTDSNSDWLERVDAQLAAAEADQAARNQNWNAARAKAAEAISLQPNNPDYQLLLVRIVIADGDPEEGQRLLSDIESKFGSSHQIVLTRSLILRQTDGNAAAYQYLYDQWQEAPDVALAPELIRLSELTGADSSESLARQWAEIEPQSAAPWVALADLQVRRGEDALAEASYRKALTRNPSHVSAMNNLAWLIREKAPEEALDLSAEAAELAPNSAAVIDTHGWILHLAGRHQEAFDTLRRAQQLAPDNADIANHLETVEAAL